MITRPVLFALLVLTGLVWFTVGLLVGHKVAWSLARREILGVADRISRLGQDPEDPR